MLLLGLLGLSACAGRAPLDRRGRTAERTPDRSSHELEQLYADAARADSAGRGEEALALLERVVAGDPHHVEAHRLLQNLELARAGRGRMIERYDRLLAAQPHDADFQYLRARLWSDPERQLRGFEAAAQDDPSRPWPWLGKGHVLLARGRTKEALRAFEAGLAARPEHRELELGRIQTLIESGAFVEARRRLLDARFSSEDERAILLEARLKDGLGGTDAGVEVLLAALLRAPDLGEVARALEERLRGQASAALGRRTLDLLAPHWPDHERTLGRVHHLAALAAGAMQEAARTAPPPSATLEAPERLVLVERGELGEVLRRTRERFAALGQLGLACPEAGSLLALVQRWEREGPSAPLRLEIASAMRSLGWTREALALLDGAPDPAEPTLAELREDLALQVSVEEQLDHYVEGVYADPVHVPDFAEFRDRVFEILRPALEREGREPGAVEYSLWPLGTMLDPSPTSGGTVAAYFAERGRLALFGKLRGQPPELLLLPVLTAGRAGPQSAYFAVCEGHRIPSYRLWLGSPLAGAALHTFGYLDVASIETEHRERAALRAAQSADLGALLDEPIPVVGPDLSRTDVTEPLELAAKLEWRAQALAGGEGTGAAQNLLAQRIDETLVHETAHLEDAQYFLSRPVRLLEVVPVVLGRHLSPVRIEGWLEMRAQCATLLRARNPYLALARCAQFVPAAAVGGGTHATGYQELLERFVARLERRPGDFPALDPTRPWLPQLHRLEPAQIRELAAEVAADLGLPVQSPYPPGRDTAARGAPNRRSALEERT